LEECARKENHEAGHNQRSLAGTNGMIVYYLQADMQERSESDLSKITMLRFWANWRGFLRVTEIICFPYILPSALHQAKLPGNPSRNTLSE
jgi:hypothetical protein